MVVLAVLGLLNKPLKVELLVNLPVTAGSGNSSRRAVEGSAETAAIPRAVINNLNYGKRPLPGERLGGAVMGRPTGAYTDGRQRTVN